MGQVVAEDTQMGQGVFTRNCSGPDIKGTRDNAQAKHNVCKSRHQQKEMEECCHHPGGATSEMDRTHGDGGKRISPGAGVKHNLQHSGRPGLTLEVLSFSGAQILAWEQLKNMKNLSGIAFRAKTFLLKFDRCGT
ncbi:hypothetical protein TURU_105197 [Turdus rufiventris]|nr:hypothetical protein TURU_105197 [Turdus rufiventris]